MCPDPTTLCHVLSGGLCLCVCSAAVYGRTSVPTLLGGRGLIPATTLRSTCIETECCHLQIL